MKNRTSFLSEHIDHFAKSQEQEFIKLEISKFEYKALAETLFSAGINLNQLLKDSMFDYTNSHEFMLVELVRVQFTKAELIKWALKSSTKDHSYRLPVALGLEICKLLQFMPCDIYMQTLLHKVHAKLVDFGFSPTFLISN